MVQNVDDLLQVFLAGWGSALITWAVLRAVFHAREAAKAGIDVPE